MNGPKPTLHRAYPPASTYPGPAYAVPPYPGPAAFPPHPAAAYTPPPSTLLNGSATPAHAHASSSAAHQVHSLASRSTDGLFAWGARNIEARRGGGGAEGARGTARKERRARGGAD